VLNGNICPNGAVMKPSAATPELLTHTGRALVFESIEDFKSRIDDPELDVDADSIMVLKGCGPRGYPGMPEVGNMPLPKKLLEQGVRDMVRISDARMSGTAFGTVVLHCAPETSVGGPLGLVSTGDVIALDAPARRVMLKVSDEELQQRRAALPADMQAVPERGWLRLHHQHVMQADRGCDLDFLVGASGDAVERESH
jgi:dihydroxy-acid dehydratase